MNSPAIWTAVYEAIDKRHDKLGMTWADLYRASGVSRATMKKMAKGVPLMRREKRMGLCEALKWDDDGIERLLRGEQPDEKLELGLDFWVTHLSTKIDREIQDRKADVDKSHDFLRKKIIQLETRLAALSAQVRRIARELDPDVELPDDAIGDDPGEERSL